MLEKTVFHWIVQYGYAGIFCLLMLGIVGLPVPDETLLMFSGFLAFKGQLAIVPALVAAFFGSTCGVTLSYSLGRLFGLPLIHEYGRYVHLTDERLARTRGWLQHSGSWSLTFGYFFPGVRHLTAYVAGTSQLPWRTFAAFAYPGGFLWSVTFVAGGYFLGDAWSRISQEIRPLAWTATLILVLGMLAYFGWRRARKPPRVSSIS